MARHDILKMLKEKDKGVGKTFGMNGTLSRLFRQMRLFDDGLSERPQTPDLQKSQGYHERTG
jgi:hypothetical protein